jgi:hypothetical protein
MDKFNFLRSKNRSFFDEKSLIVQKVFDKDNHILHPGSPRHIGTQNKTAGRCDL